MINTHDGKTQSISMVEFRSRREQMLSVLKNRVISGSCSSVLAKKDKQYFLHNAGFYLGGSIIIMAITTSVNI